MNECTIADLIETIDDSLSPNDFGGYDISRDKAKNLDAALEAARKQAALADSNIIAAARELIRQAELSLDYRPEFRHAISNLHSALASPVAGWVSVEERLPELGVQVLAYRPTAAASGDTPIRVIKRTGREIESWQGVKHDFEGICHVTHWQPLPSAPAATPTQQEQS